VGIGGRSRALPGGSPSVSGRGEAPRHVRARGRSWRQGRRDRFLPNRGVGPAGAAVLRVPGKRPQDRPRRQTAVPNVGGRRTEAQRCRGRCVSRRLSVSAGRGLRWGGGAFRGCRRLESRRSRVHKRQGARR